MRYYLYVLMILGGFIAGCSEDNGVVSPADTISEEPNWIVMPASEDLSIKKEVSTSKWIYGDQESLVEINTNYAGGPFGWVSITANARFQRNSFTGARYVTMSVNDQCGTSTFLPSGTFSKPVLYNLTLVGVDLSNVNPATVKFVYMAPDGNYYPAKCESLIVDKQNGRLEVRNAELPHFSRYGYIN